MSTTIDKAGRIVIPKAIRESLGFGPGTEIEIVQSDGEVTLRRSAPPPRLERIRGRLVARTTSHSTPTAIDIAAIVEAERERWPS